jgi:double zinc ribbon protein
MRCAKCGTKGIVGKKFCAECGSPLPNRCSKCGSDNALGAKFCADCGTPLVAATPATRADALTPAVGIAEPAEAGALEGERKTVQRCSPISRGRWS